MRSLVLTCLLALPSLALPTLALAAPQSGGAGREQAAAQAAAQLQAKFNQADTNHDGKLTQAEAQKGMPRIAKNFSRIDTVGNGYVTLEQLLAMGQQAAAGLERAAAQLQTKFNQADTNHDGKLTLAEAQKGMPGVARNFSRIDVAGNGYVTLEQFRAMAQQAAAAAR